MRIVSLVCSNTEIVHALGLTSELVGVDDHSDHPANALEGLPRLGPELGIRVSQIEELRPDLVLASLSVPGHERVVENLEKEGLPHLVLDPTSLSDVFGDIRTVAKALGVEARGEEVVSGMERTFAEVRAPAGSVTDTRPPSILVQWWPNPVISPGKLSWVHDLLDIAGARNPLGGEEVRSRPLADEEVASVAPDAIVLSWCGISPAEYQPEVVLENPLWQHLPAVQNRQVHCIPEAFMGRPGPRLVEGARALAEVVAAVRRNG